MIKAIQKRPFLRPLIVWIAGILLQTYGSVRIPSFGLLLIPVLLLFTPEAWLGVRKPEAAYSARWVWGTVFVCLFLFASIQSTAYHESRSPYPSNPLLQDFARQAREQLIEPFDHLRLTEAERSVLSSITIGYRSEMPQQVRQQFSITGVTHILSVSGFHVAIICNALLWTLSFLSKSPARRWIRYILTILLLWIFTVISGLAAASIRATIMLTLYLTGRQIYRKTDGYNTLAASAFCMLLYNPVYLFDIGFQLSYIAVGFILYLQPRLSRMIQPVNPLLKTPWEWITLTLAAQTGVAFLCLYYFGQFSSVFLLANLPIMLISILLIPAALVWMLLPAWLPGWDMIGYVVEAFTRSMMWIVDSFSRMPGSSFSFRFDFVTMALCYGALLCTFIYCERRQMNTNH
ncbi:MAG: ComEC/Rec2 family competence protein [Tannerellaceae bacterium]|nr:ComEC/Rec2 family competence protein [Tannerellaceae bacterium]